LTLCQNRDWCPKQTNLSNILASLLRAQKETPGLVPTSAQVTSQRSSAQATSWRLRPPQQRPSV